MTTPPGWEPRPGPTRGDPARRPPRGGTPNWSAGGQDGRPDGDRGRGGPPPASSGNSGRGWNRGQGGDPRQQRQDGYGPAGRERDGRYPAERPAPGDRRPRPTGLRPYGDT